MASGELERCPQCGAMTPPVAGPGHAYIASSAGCWAAMAELQATLGRRFGGVPGGRLVVDAYGAQHPGDGSDRRDRQSVFVHLAALCAVLERGWPPERAIDVRRWLLAGEREFPVLRRPPGPPGLTHQHLSVAADGEDYDRRARAWARSVWEAWGDARVLVRARVARL